MSIFKKLFGGGSVKPKAQEGVKTSYEGYEIEAQPYDEGGQYRLAGFIRKQIAGVDKEHMLVRADVFSGHTEACEATIRKAKHLIDEQGERLFGA